jgi:transcription antitermination factor NusG
LNDNFGLTNFDERRGFALAGAEQQAWYAVKVRTNAEERIKASLATKGEELFLPTYVEARRYSDRIRKVSAPLFPGYLFCRLDIEKRLPILQTPGVDHFVGIANVPQAIPDSEIDALKIVSSSGLATEPWPYLQAGDEVRIHFGALSGLTGLLVQTKGADRLVLSVQLLQRSISVEVDRGWVRPVASPKAPHAAGMISQRPIAVGA